MSWVDSHCHLGMIDAEFSEVLDRAEGAGVALVVDVGVDLASSAAAAERAAADTRVVATAGIHPNDCAHFGDTEERALNQIASQPEVVAIGETGMDLYRDRTDPADQEKAFRAQIQMAKELGKALIVHCRDAYGEVRHVLADEEPPERVVMHCFAGDADDARHFLDLGAYLSIAGPVTFESAKALQAVVRGLPLDRLLVETDSPFLSPHPLRGRPNEPARVALVGEAVAEILGHETGEVAEVTSANARSVFGKG